MLQTLLFEKLRLIHGSAALAGHTVLPGSVRTLFHDPAGLGSQREVEGAGDLDFGSTNRHLFLFFLLGVRPVVQARIRRSALWAGGAPMAA